MPIDEVLYPVNLRVRGHRCLVVGGGQVALVKVDGLLEAGAVVEVIAPDVIPELDARPGVTVHRRVYQSGDVEGYRLVVAATGRAEVDAEVYRDGEATGVWVNSADDPDNCSFTLPSRLRRGPLLVTCSTGGHSPALSRWLRQRLEQEIGPEYQTLLCLLSEARERIRSTGVHTEGLAWQDVLDSGMLELIRSGETGQAQAKIDRLVDNTLM
ncbi:MAG: bifunctional precorrin-2 dehydrogenase/sirohydrochlorin ferrochelatase [Acidimicrobiia bacterium]|nr:bifunctional precorrin-2 dehydrogenase/sirohydrochlorin ferrochelatase [Acidimicrobiia bacterium]MYG71702.1 bifunctional precorrin-2 dehydrogenase/sirohydrochlorin ferrochelatase [Acidimicrobiia bacterium]